jgi:hypothetical protein
VVASAPEHQPQASYAQQTAQPPHRSGGHPRFADRASSHPPCAWLVCCICPPTHPNTWWWSCRAPTRSCASRCSGGVCRRQPTARCPWTTTQISCRCVRVRSARSHTAVQQQGQCWVDAAVPARRQPTWRLRVRHNHRWWSSVTSCGWMRPRAWSCCVTWRTRYCVAGAAAAAGPAAFERSSQEH